MTSALERDLLGGIPLEEGASFYLMLKRAQEEPGLAALQAQGGPEEMAPSAPPSGAPGGQFLVPVEHALSVMAEVLENEIKTMYAYKVYANSLRDLSHHSLAEEFEEHAEEELEHADFLLRRMAVLGGPIHAPDIPAPPASSDPIDILQTMVEMEQEGIAKWQALHSIIGEDPMKYKIEEFLVREQEHLDELWQMLPQEARSLGGELKQASIRAAVAKATERVVSSAKNVADRVENFRSAKGGLSAAKEELKYQGKRIAGSAGIKDHVSATARTVKKKAPGVARAAKEKATSLAGAAATKIRDAVENLPTIEEAASRMADRAVAGRKKGREVAYQARRAVGKDSVSENLLRAAKPGLEKAEKAIRENPGKAALVATAIPAASVLALRGNSKEKKASASDHIERAVQRAEGNLASRARKHEGSRGELYGDLVGRVLAGGAGLTAAKGKGDLAQVAAVALSQHLGGKAGKLLGKELDVRRDLRKASEGKKKHAFDGTEELGTPSGLPPGAPQGMAPQMGQPQASGSPEEIEAQEAMALEQQGAEAQAANEAEYYKELSRQQSQAKEQLEGQMQAIQQELEQTKQLQEQQNQMVQQTLQGANNTATQALTQAVSSTQEAIRQRQQAADGAITLDRLRQSLRELADGGGSPGGPGDITGGGQQQMAPDQMQGAPADQAPSAGAPPDAQDPQGGYAPIQSQSQGEPQPAGQEGMVATASIRTGVRAFRKSRRVEKAMEDLSSRFYEELARSPRDAAALNSAAVALDDAIQNKQHLNSIALESLAVPAAIATGVALPTVAAAGYFAGRSAKNRAAKAIAEEVLPEIASKRSKNLLPLAAGGVAVPALVGGAYLAGSASPEAAGQEGMVATASLYKEAKTSKIREGLRKYVQNLRGDRIKYEKEVIQPSLYAELDSLMDARQQARLAGDPIDGFRIEFEGRHYRDALDASRRRLYGAERDTEIARGLTGLGGAALLGGGAYALNKALKNRAAKAVAEEALPEIASKGSKNLLPLVAGGVAVPALAGGAYLAGSGSPECQPPPSWGHFWAFSPTSWGHLFARVMGPPPQAG